MLGGIPVVRSGVAVAGAEGRLIAETEALTIGSVEDFGNFTSAVIDDRSFGRLKAAIDRAHATDSHPGDRRRHL